MCIIVLYKPKTYRDKQNFCPVNYKNGKRFFFLEKCNTNATFYISSSLTLHLTICQFAAVSFNSRKNNRTAPRRTHSPATIGFGVRAFWVSRYTFVQTVHALDSSSIVIYILFSSSYTHPSF